MPAPDGPPVGDPRTAVPAGPHGGPDQDGRTGTGSPEVDPATATRSSQRAGVRRWLRPGIGVKRWLVVSFLGLLALALAGALVLKQVYREVELTGPLQAVVWAVTLQFLPYHLRAIPLVVGGFALLFLGVFMLVRTLLSPFGERSEPLAEQIYQKRSLARGPRIVAIGGGTGLHTLLRGLKQHTSNITAVVTVADDGGSSGKLRAEFGIAPMGDIRNCIAALADAEPLMTRLLQYRFPEDTTGEPSLAPPGLGGHSFGNLFIAAMSAIEGDFEEGVRQSNRVLAVRGQVVPASSVPLTLRARLASGGELTGQSLIARATGIDRVCVTPADAPVTEEALEAVATADLIVLGPGSLFTSLMPSLLLLPLRDAIAASPAIRVYVCNVATQLGETEGYGLADHLAALGRHAGDGIYDVVLANDDFAARRSPDDPSMAVRLDWAPPPGRPLPALVAADIVDVENAHQHDPARLAAALVEIGRDRERYRPAPAVVARG
jgi:uncharacterized cofD-like protein